MIIKPILSICVKHQYYNDGCCRNFTLHPDSITEQFIQKNQMYSRRLKNVWTLFADCDRVCSFPLESAENAFVLKFELRSDDKDFYLSEGNTIVPNAANCLCNLNKNNEQPAVQCKRYSCEYFKKNEYLKSMMHWQIIVRMDKKQMFKKPEIVTVNFKAKEVYWKYGIFNNIRNDTLSITGLDKRISFSQIEAENYGDNTATVFISDQKIPLRLNDEHQFKLMVKKGGMDKCIVKRLPTATASSIRYKNNDKKEFISLIFVTI